MRSDILKRLNEYKNLLEEKGYNVLYIGLYGSQNYNLQHCGSDIDARAIVLLPIRDILQGKSVSKTIEIDNDASQIDVKDFMSFYKVLKKGNPAYAEVVKTKYWVGDPKVREMFEGANSNPRAILGMMHEKKAAIQKGLPRTAPTVGEYGYDTKQLHHILRLSDILKMSAETSKNVTFIEYENGDKRDSLVKMKKGEDEVLDKDSALELANTHIEVCKNMIGMLTYTELNSDEEVLDFLEKLYTGGES